MEGGARCGAAARRRAAAGCARGAAAVSARRPCQRGGSGAEHEAAGVGGHLEAVARGVAGAEERAAAAVAELVDGQ
ncbi:hypothetical protein, partial [Selenomonas bovis]|uniref:hypothetical protein n=1 Tax=Selenomonas bovis TaxID=416586 RepID=UPI003AB99C41